MTTPTRLTLLRISLTMVGEIGSPRQIGVKTRIPRAHPFLRRSQLGQGLRTRKGLRIHFCVIALRDNARGTVPRAVASGSPRDRNPVATARGTVPCVTTGGWLKLGGVVFFSSSPAVYSLGRLGQASEPDLSGFVPRLSLSIPGSPMNRASNSICPIPSRKRLG